MQNCDRCDKEIPLGTPYVCIDRNIEYMDISTSSQELNAEVIDSVQVLVLCSKCGNSFDADNILRIIKAIPTNNSNIIGN